MRDNMSISEISQLCPTISNSTISTTITRLWKDKKLAEKKILPENQRITNVSLTAEGRRVFNCATRIRNMFLRTPMPVEVETRIRGEIAARFKDKSAVVRSSAPDEDDASASFAGLHESYLNINGVDAILEHIRKVWASLWSDAALLYRQEIGLDVEKSSMAVVIQEIVAGDRSGVAFSQNPNDPSQAVIEAVYGLNQGLVDGLVQPDRWILDRERKSIVSHSPADRDSWMVARGDGVELEPLPDSLASEPPLSSEEVAIVFELAARAEENFKLPQDVEWTFRDEALFVLQSRPITTLANENSGDKRGWYLSLHRSFENLKSLRLKRRGSDHDKLLQFLD
jgi:phosphoenolpyruvate synthase/pyruvate phosphate dikinase